ncbi:hypothetical protein MVEG_03526 [Podila verticillata NRRL 6337]|nr:hypothetical protein MVEG_03526 [Podila verticillata NRRL 6337]
MNTRNWKGRVKALLTLTFATKATSHNSNNYHIHEQNARAPKNRFVKAYKAFFQRASPSRSKENKHCRCQRHHLPPPLTNVPDFIPYRSESRTLEMARSVRLAGRVLDSLQEQKFMTARAHTPYPYPDPEDLDSASDMSNLPPRTPYRLLDGPDIENIEAYIEGWCEDLTNEYDCEVATATLGRSASASSRRHSRAPSHPLSDAVNNTTSSSTLHSPRMVDRCKTSRGRSSVHRTGQATPSSTPTSSLFSMPLSLKSPCSSLSHRFSTRVGVMAPKRSMELAKNNASSSSCLNLKDEYNSEDDEKKEKHGFYGYESHRIRRSRSTLQRLDHGALESEIRSPNGLANTPKTTTFRNWERALRASSGYGSQGGYESQERASPQTIVPHQGSTRHRHHHHQHHANVEKWLAQDEKVVRQIKTCVRGRLALEDRFCRTERRLREHEDGARDWEAKYWDMCRKVAQVQAQATY